MYVRTPADIGAAIREHRRRRRLPQQELADKVGVSRQWLIEVERGKPRAEIGLVLKTLAVLGLRVALDDGQSPAGESVSVPAPPDIDALVSRARKRQP